MREFDALGNGPQHESLLLQLCLYKHLCNYISERYGTRFMWSRFCILRRNLQESVAVLCARTVKSFPYVVQAFNQARSPSEPTTAPRAVFVLNEWLVG